MSLLAGDLGGTKTLLAIYEDSYDLKKLYQRKYISKDYESIDNIINDFLSNLPQNLHAPSVGCIGVAGRVTNGKAKITNLDWDLDEKQICSLAKLEKLEIVNDFGVLIYGLPFLNKEQFVDINKSSNNESIKGVVAVIGAGTGLGIARGIIKEEEIISLPSEGGHKEFAPRSEKEMQLAKWIKKDLALDRLSIERVVSGTGLGNICRWRLQQSDVTHHSLKKISEEWHPSIRNGIDLPALTSKGAQNGDPLMKEIMDIWLSAYGSVVGDLALEELCHAGLWITGGTASKNLEGLTSKVFLKAIYNKGRFRKFIENLPIKILTDNEIGLFSAACKARMMTKQNGTLRSLDKI